MLIQYEAIAVHQFLSLGRVYLQSCLFSFVYAIRNTETNEVCPVTNNTSRLLFNPNECARSLWAQTAYFMYWNSIKFSELETTWWAGPAEQMAKLTPPAPYCSRAYPVTFMLRTQSWFAHCGARAEEPIPPTLYWSDINAPLYTASVTADVWCIP